MDTLEDPEYRESSWSNSLKQLLMTVFGIGILIVMIASQMEPKGNSRSDNSWLTPDSEVAPPSSIWSIALSPLETDIAYSTIEGDVWLKSMASGRVDCLKRGKPGMARSVAFSPDGRVLAAVGREASVWFWDLRRGTELPRLQFTGEMVKSIAFAPKGSMLAVGHARERGGRGTITVCDWTTRQRLFDLGQHPGSINFLAFSHDCKRLAAGDSEGFIKIWDLTTGIEQRSFQAAKTGINALAFSPDGAWLAASAALTNELLIWDAGKFETSPSMVAPAPAISSFAFAPQGQTVAIVQGDGATSLWDMASKRIVARTEGQGRSLYCVAFTFDGQFFITGGANGSLQTWSLAKMVQRQPSAQGS